MKKIIIQQENAGMRIDKFLQQEVFLNMGISRGEIIRIIKSGNIAVQGKKVKPSYLLKAQDGIVVPAMEVALAGRAGELVSNPNLAVPIIFQDENIIVIDKPAGLKVHPSSLAEKDTLVNYLLAKFPEIKKVSDRSLGSELRPGIVHRLDKDTSGVLVVARNQRAYEALKDIFKNRQAEKKYMAIVYGKLPNKTGIIDSAIARAESYKKQIIAGQKTKTKIREAVTEYTVKQEYQDYSMVEARPKTGRMHQIRVHFFSIGHPLVGDKMYKLKEYARLSGAARQMLHAEALKFKILGRDYAFASPRPSDIVALLKSLT